MKKNEKIAVAVVAVILGALILFSSGAVGPKGDRGDKGLSGSAGPRHTTRNYFNEGLSTGHRVATTTLGAVTTESLDFRTAQTYWDVLPNVNTTITINATSTFPYVPNVGNTAKMYIRNASTTAASTITLAAQNSSVDLQYVEATGGDLVLSGLDWSELTLIRESAFVVSILVNEFTEAD